MEELVWWCGKRGSVLEVLLWFGSSGFSSGMMLRAGGKCMRWRGRGRGRPRFLVALSLSLRRLFFSTLFSRGPNSHVFRRRSVPLSRLGWNGEGGRRRNRSGGCSGIGKSTREKTTRRSKYDLSKCPTKKELSRRSKGSSIFTV